jgi:hypothetical protein
MPVSRVYRVATPFNASELPQVDYEQTADVIYLAHENHVPQKVIRHDHTNWEFAEVAFSPTIGIPQNEIGTATIANTDAANSGNAYFEQPASYVVTAFDEITGQESRPSNVITLTNDLGLKRNYNTISWTAVAGATGYRIYKSENTQSYGNIGTTDAISFRDDNIGPDLSSGPPVGDNPFEADGDRPSTITFHEQRSWWGRTRNRPNGLWASRSADYENMDYTRPGREDDSIVIGLVASKVNSVNRLLSTDQGLLALTSNNVFAVQGSNEDYITATPPPRVRPKVSRGASRLKPILIDSVVFYETSKAGEVRTIGYDFQLDGLKTDDVSIFSRHLFEGFSIKSWTFAEKPASAIWVVRSDGKLLCLTWDQAQQVWGWTVCETDGLYLKVCAITEQSEDRVYCLIQRTINGVTKYYIERMTSELWTDQVDACFLDCARTFTNTGSIAVYDRLDHLEGKTVVAWVDGKKVSVDPNGDPLVVTNGSVTLQTGGTKVHIGLPFTADIETLPLALQTQQGWTVAQPQSAERAFVKVINSRGIKAGVSADQLLELKQREHEDYPDPTALFTGFLEIPISGSSGTETTVFIRSEDPTPLEVAAVLVDPSYGNMG